MDIAVIVERRDGALTAPALELLTLARDLGEPVAVTVGDAPSAGVIDALAEYGAARVIAVTADADALATPAGLAAAWEAGIGEAPVALFTASFAAKEAAALLGHRTGAGVSVDCSGVSVADGAVETVQNVFAATWNVRTRITADRAIVGIRANSVISRAADTATDPDVHTVAVGGIETRERVVSREAVDRAEGVPLAEAPVVVAGGRGTAGDYTLVRELADVLGAAVGATRDATDEGWISHEHMVGQTGTTVTPGLYVACGISGAVHHRGGMQASGTIVAVNIDPDAPIFEIADFGVVGDLNDVIPQAIEAIRAHKG